MVGPTDCVREQSTVRNDLSERLSMTLFWQTGQNCAKECCFRNYVVSKEAGKEGRSEGSLTEISS